MKKNNFILSLILFFLYTFKPSFCTNNTTILNGTTETGTGAKRSSRVTLIVMSEDLQEAKRLRSAFKHNRHLHEKKALYGDQSTDSVPVLSNIVHAVESLFSGGNPQNLPYYPNNQGQGFSMGQAFGLGQQGQGPMPSTSSGLGQLFGLGQQQGPGQQGYGQYPSPAGIGQSPGQLVTGPEPGMSSGFLPGQGQGQGYLGSQQPGFLASLFGGSSQQQQQQPSGYGPQYYPQDGGSGLGLGFGQGQGQGQPNQGFGSWMNPQQYGNPVGIQRPFREKPVEKLVRIQ